MAFRTAGQRDTFDHLIAGAPANKTLQAIDAADRLSFRRFIGLGVGDLPPDDTTLVRFRQRTRAGGLIGKARRELERQLDAKAVRIRAGSLKVVDATLVPAATRPPRGPEAKERSAEESTPAEAKSPEVQSAEPSAMSSRRLDPDARFGGKKGKLRFGYKVHAAIEMESRVVTDFRVTPANVADTTVFGELLGDTEAGVLADKGYDSAKNRAALAARGALDGIMRRVGARAKSALGAIETARNRFLSKHRSPLEGTFASLKRWRRMGRAIYTGLARVQQQIELAMTIHNGLKLLKLREKCAR